MIYVTKKAGEKIKEIRQSKRMKQTELAKSAGISNSTMSKIEKGETKTKESIFEMVLNVLNVSEKDIFIDDERTKIIENNIEVLEEDDDDVIDPKDLVIAFLERKAKKEKAVLYRISENMAVMIKTTAYDLNKDPNIHFHNTEKPSPVEEIVNESLIDYLQDEELFVVDRIHDDLMLNKEALELVLRGFKR